MYDYSFTKYDFFTCMPEYRPTATEAIVLAYPQKAMLVGNYDFEIISTVVVEIDNSPVYQFVHPECSLRFLTGAEVNGCQPITWKKLSYTKKEHSSWSTWVNKEVLSLSSSGRHSFNKGFGYDIKYDTPVWYPSFLFDDTIYHFTGRSKFNFYNPGAYDKYCICLLWDCTDQYHWVTMDSVSFEVKIWYNG